MSIFISTNYLENIQYTVHCTIYVSVSVHCTLHVAHSTTIPYSVFRTSMQYTNLSVIKEVQYVTTTVTRIYSKYADNGSKFQ